MNMEDNNNMAHPFKPGETAGHNRPEPESIQVEHAHRALAKRRRFTGPIKAIASAGLAIATITVVGNAMEQGEKNHFKPDSYYGGTVEINMNENLNLRETPIIISDPNIAPNTVNWHDVVQINGVNIKGKDNFVIEKPLITEGDNPEASDEKSPWITFQATIDQPLTGPKTETLYINFSATRDYVKPIETGAFIKIDNSIPPSEFGKIKTTP